MSNQVTTETILEAFEEQGLRQTRPRRLIAQRLADLAADGADFTTDDLWRALQHDDPTLGRATVYRAVDVLVERGLLDRVAFADGSHRYRMCGERHHHHLTCTRCHRIIEVDACLSHAVLSAIAARADFAVEGHSIEIFGRCAACRVENDAERAPSAVPPRQGYGG
jgi:Fe2+ or Zn2+ uptake regulation protein